MSVYKKVPGYPDWDELRLKLEDDDYLLSELQALTELEEWANPHPEYIKILAAAAIKAIGA